MLDHIVLHNRLTQTALESLILYVIHKNEGTISPLQALIIELENARFFKKEICPSVAGFALNVEELFERIYFHLVAIPFLAKDYQNFKMVANIVIGRMTADSTKN